MAENKKSFLLYCDNIESFETLSDEEAGRLIKHIFRYVNDQNPVAPDKLTELGFIPIKNQLKRDLAKWELEIKNKSDAGIIGNLKRWHNDLYIKVSNGEISLDDALIIAQNRKTSHTDTLQSQSITEIAVTDTVKVNDTVKVILSIKDRKLKFSQSLEMYLDKFGKEMLNDFYSYWTEIGEKDKKMRFEKQSTFEISKRLDRWFKNTEKGKEKKVAPKKESDEPKLGRQTMSDLEHNKNVLLQVFSKQDENG